MLIRGLGGCAGPGQSFAHSGPAHHAAQRLRRDGGARTEQELRNKRSRWIANTVTTAALRGQLWISDEAHGPKPRASSSGFQRRQRPPAPSDRRRQ